MLQDVMETNVAVGGKVIVLGGDFNQILPIVSYGTRREEIEACIKNSYLWQVFKIFILDINMRAADHDGQFAMWVKNIGDGNLDAIEYVENNFSYRFPRDVVEIPEACIQATDIENWVSDDLNCEEIYSRAVCIMPKK